MFLIVTFYEQDQRSKAPSRDHLNSSFMARPDYIMAILDYPFPDLTRFDLIQLDQTTKNQ